MLVKMNCANADGGSKPVEKVESDFFSIGGVSATHTCTFSNKIKAIIAFIDNSQYGFWKVDKDGTYTFVKGNNSAFVQKTSETSVIVYSSWSATRYYCVYALTTDNLDEIDFTS